MGSPPLQLQDFKARVIGAGPGEKLDFDHMSIGELKAYLNSRHVSYADLIEKSEFVAKAKATADMLSS